MLIEFAGVNVVRGGKRILDEIDWQVAEDQRWVILGPNGAGKTTLLALAATLIHPSAGVASVLDELLGLTDVFELRPRIGVASASLAQHIDDDEPVLDVVRTGAYAMFGHWREQYEGVDNDRASRLLELWGVASLAERSFGTLSEGERKRVQIARALMSDPELLLLDEPTAGLDMGGREDLLSRFANFASDPNSPVTLTVTHHIEEIPVGTTHALLLKDGKVAVSGPVAQVITSQHVSAVFGIQMEVTSSNGRFYARAI